MFYDLLGKNEHISGHAGGLPRNGGEMPVIQPN
jgi:hypothetical protein